jgi:2-polyprenyl-3-methyl-5-hydroxy-6-metoxy-1,4-benzoquinol methylase
VCGANGDAIYHDLSDHLFGVEGEWSMRQCSDDQCGLLWLDPMPAPESLGALYKHYYTHNYDKPSTASPLFAIYEHLRSAYCSAEYGYSDNRWSGIAIRYLARLLPGVRTQWDLSVFCLSARPGSQVLDVGCGSGRMMRRLAELGWQVHGLDFDPKAVEAARNLGLEVRLGTLEEQNYEEGSFDAIIMNHVIEHVPDPLELLKSCKRVLKPGGKLVLATPNAWSWGHQRYGRSWRGLEPPRHLHIFTPQAIRKLAVGAGFNRLQVSTTVANAHSVLWSSRQLSRNGKLSPYVFSFRSGAWGTVMQVAEWVKLRSYPNSGEEVLFQARA